jgi:N-acetylglucosamine-6-phosphate deacetylase
MGKTANQETEGVTIPGLVDLQVNGFRGVDFSSIDLTEAAFARACRELLAAGTTAFLPTLITSPTAVYEHNLPLIAKTIRRQEFRGRVLGVHLEGPFLSPVEGARGAHNPKWMRTPDLEHLKRLVEWADGTVSLLTIAADQEGAEGLARYATDHGIAVSLGHHMADDDDLRRLVTAGAKALTHLGNGVPSAIDRHQNPVWAGLGNDELWATIIADGHHLPPSLLKTIIRTKGPGRCVVISDASPLAGMAPGRYQSMGAEVILEKNGHLYNPATGYMAGSSATLLTCAIYLASLNLVNSEHLAEMVWDNPLKLIGLTPGHICAGEEICLDGRPHIISHTA